MMHTFLFAAASLVAAAVPKGGMPRELADKIVVDRDVEYGRAGDRPLLLDVIRPKQPKAEKLPVVVWIHGGGWRSGDKSSGLERIGRYAATGNYWCASIGYRLSGEATWPAQIHDVKAAIRYLHANAAKYHIDAERIGIWGSSAGGHLVSLLGISGDVDELAGENGSAGASSRVACVVDFCGPSDFAAINTAREKEGKQATSAIEMLLGGTMDEKNEAVRAASPITYVSADDPPFLIVHGTQDPVVPFDQAERFYVALKKAGVDATLVRMVGAGHGLGGPELMERVDLFFEKHLLGRDVEVSGESITAADAAAPARRAPAAKPRRR